MTLQELRTQNKKSRQEVAKALGVTPNAITNYENGTRRIDIEQTIELANLYEITAEEVIEAQLRSIKLGKSD